MWFNEKVQNSQNNNNNHKTKKKIEGLFTLCILTCYFFLQFKQKQAVLNYQIRILQK